MAALTRRESEERRRGVLNWFLAHPDATGDEAQRALINGQITGKKGPPMGIGALYDIKREADRMRTQGAIALSSSAAPVNTEQAGVALAELRDLASKLQALLSQLPQITEVRVTREGASMMRAVTREEKL